MELIEAASEVRSAAAHHIRQHSTLLVLVDVHAPRLCSMFCFWQGEVATVVRLLKSKRCDVNFEDDEGSSAIHYAAAANNSDVLEELFKFRPKLNGRDGCGMAALHHCVDSGEDVHLDALQVLLEAKCDPNVRDSDQDTPLLISAERGHLLAVDLLLSHKADINLQTALDKRTPLHIAAEQGENP
jgi:ankyrin repeat protein